MNRDHNLAPADPTLAEAAVRTMLTASDIATAEKPADKHGFRKLAQEALAELRGYDEQFGTSNGIAEAVIYHALWKAYSKNVDSCSEAVRFAFNSAGIVAIPPDPRDPDYSRPGIDKVEG